MEHMLECTDAKKIIGGITGSETIMSENKEELMTIYNILERLSNLKIYSLQRRERYIIIYVWKILENLVPNLVKPLQFYVSDRRGRLCSVSHVRLGHTGTLAYSSFRWKGIRLFNSLPMHLRNITGCPPLVFKKQLDLHLSPILDCPCTPNFNNRLDNKY